MPLPKKMDKCMSKVKKEFPEGRSDKKKSKKEAHKQHVAMCLNAQESYSMKDLIDGMTLKSFLIAEAQMADPNTVRGYIQSLPPYQELKGSDQSRGEAIKLARELMDELGGPDAQIDQATADYVFDAFDELNSRHNQGMNVGDWKGEEEYKKKEQEDQDLESAIDKWEQTTGMDAETGAPVKKKRMGRGATMQKARFDKAKQEVQAFADAPASDQVDRVASARSQAQGASAPQRGNKASAARAIFNEYFGEERPSAIIRRMMDEVGMSKPHATTYYYKFKKAAAQQ